MNQVFDRMTFSDNGSITKVTELSVLRPILKGIWISKLKFLSWCLRMKSQGVKALYVDWVAVELCSPRINAIYYNKYLCDCATSAFLHGDLNARIDYALPWTTDKDMCSADIQDQRWLFISKPSKSDKLIYDQESLCFSLLKRPKLQTSVLLQTEHQCCFESSAGMCFSTFWVGVQMQSSCFSCCSGFNACRKNGSVKILGFTLPVVV